MISRRKFLQGALGFASAAILPAGVIMPIKGKIEEPQIVRIEPFNFYPNPEDEHIYGSDINSVKFYDNDQVEREFPEVWHDQALYDAITQARSAMDAANVPQEGRTIWLPKYMEKPHVT